MVLFLDGDVSGSSALLQPGRPWSFELGGSAKGLARGSILTRLSARAPSVAGAVWSDGLPWTLTMPSPNPISVVHRAFPAVRSSSIIFLLQAGDCRVGLIAENYPGWFPEIP